jgi:GTP-binding protein YchF
MSLSIGIVGLPNVGKSTVFNALTGAQNAMVANYPFCTIQPNRAVVPLPDPRLDRLGELVKVPEVIYATLEFVDIAGLVKGAHKGEGLGNQFLGHVRDSAAILHVVRCFEDPNVVHVNAQPSPREDIEVINVELALADLQQLERKIERLQSTVKGDRKLIPTLEMCLRLQEYLSQGKPAARFSEASDEKFHELDREMRFLTAKPLIYIANVDETGLTKTNPYLEETRQLAKEQSQQVVVLCGLLEEELQEMSEAERSEYQALAGIESSGLQQVTRQSFALLKLISFFTFNEKQARAWNIPRETTAPQAAGTIHTDFERGFIRAEVIPFEVFDKYSSHAAVKAAGRMRLEGKEYVVQDGDVIYFRFNV